MTKQDLLSRTKPGLFFTIAIIALISGCVLWSGILMKFIPPEAAAYTEILAKGITLVKAAIFGTVILALISAFFWRFDERPFAQWEAPKIDRKDVFVFIGLFVVSAILRYLIISSSLWWDELANVLRYIRRGFPVIFTFAGGGNNHILNCALVRVVFNLFGEGEMQMRFPAFILGAITPSVAYVVLRSRLNRGVALITGCIMSFHFTFLVHSTESRGYAGAILFGILACFLFSKLFYKSDFKMAVGYIICVVLAFGFLPTAGIIPFSQAIACFLLLLYSFINIKQSGNRRSYINAGICCMWAGILSLVFFGITFLQVFDFHAYNMPYDYRQLSPGLIGDMLEYFSGVYFLPLAALMGIISLSGWMTFKKDQGFLISFLAPVAAAGVWLLCPGARMFPRTLFFITPVVILGIAFMTAVVYSKRNRIILKIMLSTVFFGWLILSAVQYYGYVTVGNPDLKGLSNRLKGCEVVLCGPQSDVNVYYFPRAKVFYSIPKSEKDKIEFFTADAIVEGVDRDARINNVLVENGFVLKETLRSYHPVRPTFFNVYMRLNKKKD